MIFTSPARRQHDVVRLHVGVQDALAVHVRQAGRDQAQDPDQLRQRQRRHLVERLAVDVLDQQVRLLDAEQPILDLLQRVNLDEVRVVELLRDVEFVLGLVEKLLLLGRCRSARP